MPKCGVSMHASIASLRASAGGNASMRAGSPSQPTRSATSAMHDVPVIATVDERPQPAAIARDDANEKRKSFEFCPRSCRTVSATICCNRRRFHRQQSKLRSRSAGDVDDVRSRARAIRVSSQERFLAPRRDRCVCDARRRSRARIGRAARPATTEQRPRGC